MRLNSTMVGWILMTMAITLVARHAFAREGLATVAQARDFGGRPLTVLVFLYTDCPNANAMAPELERIRTEFAPKGVAFFRVYADDSLSDEAIAKHGEEYKLNFPAVRDDDLELVKLTGATVTPEAVVYDREGRRRYRGRINNRFEELGRHRQVATEHDLRDALDALMAGKEPPRTETKAVGCYLPEVKEQQAPMKEAPNEE